jgi:hypothetical protein
MTARRLRRENKPDVKRFLYVPLPIATVSFVGSGNTRVAVERLDSSHLVVNHRNVATCRILSRNAAIGHWLAMRKKLNFTVPRPPRHFLNK